MELFSSRPSSRIKSNAAGLVKPGLGAVLLCALAFAATRLPVAEVRNAATAPSRLLFPSALAAEDVEPQLPEIEARSFDITVSKRSSTKRIYLADTPVELPRVGKILLLKRGDEPVIALKVLKI